MKKTLLGLTVALVLGTGLFTSCIYDNYVDTGNGKIIPAGIGDTAVPYDENYGPFVNPDFTTAYDIEIWIPDYIADGRPTFAINTSLGFFSVGEYGWWGGRLGGYENLTGTKYDLSELASATVDIIVPDGTPAINFYFILGALVDGNGNSYEPHKMEFNNIGPGSHHLTIDKLNTATTTSGETVNANSANILTLGGDGSNYNFIMKNITFYDITGDVILDFPIVSEEAE